MDVLGKDQGRLGFAGEGQREALGFSGREPWKCWGSQQRPKEGLGFCTGSQRRVMRCMMETGGFRVLCRGSLGFVLHEVT